MANISFLVKGSEAINEQHVARAWVTIEEMSGGTLYFKVKQVGGVMGNLHGLYFDITDESIMRTLRVKAMSMDVRAEEDSAIGVKNGTELTESFTGKCTRSVGAKDIVREYAFTLQSDKRALALSDFSSMQLDYSDHQNEGNAFAVNDDDSHRWLYLALL